jgi:hypothetical protein
MTSIARNLKAAAAAVLVLVAAPAQAGMGPIFPSVVFTTVYAPQYSLTCPPQLIRLSVTSLSVVSGPLSTTFFRTVGVNVTVVSPSGFTTVVPSNQPYNLVPVVTTRNTATVGHTDSFPVRGIYRATGGHLFIRASGDSIVHTTPTSFTN